MFSLKRQSLVFQIALAASCVSLAIFAALIGLLAHVVTRLARACHGDSSGVRGAAWLWPD